MRHSVQLNTQTPNLFLRPKTLLHHLVSQGLLLALDLLECDLNLLKGRDPTGLCRASSRSATALNLTSLDPIGPFVKTRRVQVLDRLMNVTLPIDRGHSLARSPRGRPAARFFTSTLGLDAVRLRLESLCFARVIVGT
jgi:hypothetical protein